MQNIIRYSQRENKAKYKNVIDIFVKGVKYIK